MKIIYLVHQFYPEYYSGTEKVVLNIASMAQKSGNIVKVITYSFYNDTFFEHENNGILYREYSYNGIPILAFKYKKQPIDLNFSLENELLYSFAEKVILNESPDIIHVGHSMRVHEFIRVAIEKNIPYIFTLTDFFLLCPKIILTPNNHSLCSGPKNGITCRNLCKEFNDNYIINRLSIARKYLENSKAIVSPSKFLAGIYKQEFDSLRFHVINHGIQYKYIKYNNRIYINNKHIIFGYAGSLAYHKGVHVLIKAFNDIKNDKIKLVLYGAGQADYVNTIKEMARNDPRITFLGPYSSEQLGDVFNNIDVLVIPSISYESYSLVLHEALASNVPVIASDLGGMSEKIEDGYTGFTFKAGSSLELKNKLELIINNITLINKLKDNIKRNVIVPTIEQESYRYYQIYNSIGGSL